MHHSDLEARIYKAAPSIGLVPNRPIKDGAWTRCGTLKKPKGVDGSILAYFDANPVALLLNNATGERLTVRSDAPASKMTAVEYAERQRVNRRREIGARQADDAANIATRRFAAAGPANASHPYLVAKEVDAFGLRQIVDVLVIPARNTMGAIRTLQFINPDASKRFMPGGGKIGHYHAIGGKPLNRLVIAEGYATGASVHMATGLPVAVAFDAGNLLPVARALRAKFPRLAIILAADNDASTVGFLKATEAAQAVNGSVWMPDQVGFDFNDLHCSAGLDAVRSAFERGIA